MVSIQKIIEKSAAFSEFEYKRTVKIEHSRTKKMVPGYHQITYENMEMEQATERSKVMSKQARAEAAQAKRDVAAETSRAQRERRRGGDRR